MTTPSTHCAETGKDIYTQTSIVSVSYFLLKHFRFNKILFSTETMLKRVCSATRSSVACRSSSFRFSTGVQAPTSTSFEKMQKDKRYKVESEVPEAVLQSVDVFFLYQLINTADDQHIFRNI